MLSPKLTYWFPHITVLPYNRADGDRMWHILEDDLDLFPFFYPLSCPLSRFKSLAENFPHSIAILNPTGCFSQITCPALPITPPAKSHRPFASSYLIFVSCTSRSQRPVLKDCCIPMARSTVWQARSSCTEENASSLFTLVHWMTQ
jgi:hypothetical protein